MWREIARRSLWLSIGSAIGRLLPFVVLVVLGRRLSSAEFASVSVGFAWTNVAAALTTSGLANVTAQRLAPLDDPVTRAHLARRVLRLGAVLAVALALAMLVIGRKAATWAFGGAVDVRVIMPAVIGGAAWCLVMLSVSIFNGLHRPRVAAIVLGVGGALQGVGLWLGYLFGEQATAALWGLVFSDLFVLVWVWRYVMTVLPMTPADPGGHGQAGFASAVVWSTLAAVCVMPVTFVAGSMTTYAAEGTRQLAAFQALEQIYQFLTYFSNIAGQALLPVLALRLVEQPSVIRRLVRVALGLAFIGSVVGAALSWDPTWLHRLVHNPALGDVHATRSMMLNAGLSASLILLGGGLLSRGQYMLATWANVMWAAIFLGLGWIWRLEGAAGLQAARLVASWVLIAVTSGALWFLSTSRCSARLQSANTPQSP